MNFQQFKTESYCFAGRYRSATTIIYGDRTSKGSNFLLGFCSYCIRKKSKTVSYNPMQAEGLGSFLKNLGRSSAEIGKQLATNIMK